MIDLLVTGIDNAEEGFSLYFSEQPFPGWQLKVDRALPEAGGNWYILDGADKQGWLCPALLRYFTEAPATIYAKAESRL